MLAYYVFAESGERWEPNLAELERVPGFDIDGGTTIVGQEKLIDRTYMATFHDEDLFLDMLNVTHMASHLGEKTSSGLLYYLRKFPAPSARLTAMCTAQYGHW